eukprot:1133697-Amphidinium_carterae.2
MSELAHDEFVTVYGSVGSESEQSNSFTALTAVADVGSVSSATSRSDPASKANTGPKDKKVVFGPGGVTMDSTEFEAGVVDQRSIAAQATHQVDPGQDSRGHGARGDAFPPRGPLVASKSTKAASMGAPPLRVISGQAVGAELPASTGRYGSADPAVCGHPNPQLKARANAKTKWWTCLACGMRFQRFQWQDHPPHAQEKMGMGRHCDLSFEEMPDDYAQWAIREYEVNGESMHPQLRRFCLWHIAQEQADSVRLPASLAAPSTTAL